MEPIDDAGVQDIERAIHAALPPQAAVEHEGWLVGLDDGTVGRAHSAVPLRHGDGFLAPVADVMALFRAHGRDPVFRIPVASTGLAAQLDLQGLAPRQPTHTMVARVPDMQAPRTGHAVRIGTATDASWRSVFLGEGFDPADAASRLALLARGHHCVFAAVEAGGAVTAVGTATFAHGWCGIHGMRTAPPWRGRGMAGAILRTFAEHARQRGIARAFLQVEAGNQAAQSIYRRAGFGTAWTYEYWRRP